MVSDRVPLEVLKIAEPCKADWARMAGDDRKRFCNGCQKFVHNLSGMTRDEAERLVCQAAGSLCIRMELKPTGTVATVGYEGSLRTRPRRGWKYWTGIGLFGALAAGAIQAVLGQTPKPLPVATPAPVTRPIAPPVMLGMMIPPTPNRGTSGQPHCVDPATTQPGRL